MRGFRDAISGLIKSCLIFDTTANNAKRGLRICNACQNRELAKFESSIRSAYIYVTEERSDAIELLSLTCGHCRCLLMMLNEILNG